ncbi:hypothetical protein GGP79_002373 [Salinibacter ruber]|uniref:hypothetical protein n=1 Tax=Salinibacter ruber TaxID=146919 RepID=UPI0021685157|nr:hypothetical protein [Salinibacter ruber]MCS3754409.1 hypothetical protein [Salinibacter ruber]
MLLTTLLLALGALAMSPAAAQVQEQVGAETTPDVKGASQSEVLIVQVGDAVGDVTDLIPKGAPGLTPADVNSASIFQDGSGNDARIRQVGTGNEAAASQLGDDNEIVITQGGSGTVPAVFGGGLPEDLSAGGAFEAVRTFRPSVGGTGNLAVAVHEGTGNQTSITQLGSNNAAGIRLNGSGNAMNLLQTGSENRFLMDTAARRLDMNVLQNGNGNSLQTNVPVRAEMNGNGIELVIRRGGGAPLPLGNGE